MDNIYSWEKVENKTSTDFCEIFFSMDPIPLNQNNAFCEGLFLFLFLFPSFIAEAFRLRSQLLLSSLSISPGG